jgi:hypothetical protein
MLTTWMVDWVLRATIILALAWVASLVLQRQAAALRHFVWTVSLASLLLLPMAWAVLPRRGYRRKATGTGGDRRFSDGHHRGSRPTTTADKRSGVMAPAAVGCWLRFGPVALDAWCSSDARFAAANRQRRLCSACPESVARADAV